MCPTILFWHIFIPCSAAPSTGPRAQQQCRLTAGTSSYHLKASFQPSKTHSNRYSSGSDSRRRVPSTSTGELLLTAAAAAGVVSLDHIKYADSVVGEDDVATGNNN